MDTTTHAKESRVPGNLVNAFIELVKAAESPENSLSNGPRTAEAQPGAAPLRWLRPTMEGLCQLPWDDSNPPDGRKPLEGRAAAHLLWLLCEVLEKDTIPPTSIVPTWRGGVTAEWHVNGFDLEIEADPCGTLEYNFAGPGIEEYEGPVDDNLENLKTHVGLLPGERR